MGGASKCLLITQTQKPSPPPSAPLLYSSFLALWVQAPFFLPPSSLLASSARTRATSYRGSSAHPASSCSSPSPSAQSALLEEAATPPSAPSPLPRPSSSSASDASGSCSTTRHRSS